MSNFAGALGTAAKAVPKDVAGLATWSHLGAKAPPIGGGSLGVGGVGRVGGGGEVKFSGGCGVVLFVFAATPGGFVDLHAFLLIEAAFRAGSTRFLVTLLGFVTLAFFGRPLFFFSCSSGVSSKLLPHASWSLFNFLC